MTYRRVTLVVLAGIAAGLLTPWLWRALPRVIALQAAKRVAIEGLQKGISQHDMPAYEMPQVRVTLPSAKPGPKREVTMAGFRLRVPMPISDEAGKSWHDFEYARFKVRVLEPTVSSPELDDLARALHVSGRFELIRAARDAKVSEISAQPTVEAVRRHVALIGLRNLYMKDGCGRLYAWFEHDGLRGIIDGDMGGKSNRMLLEVVEPAREAIFSIIIHGNGNATLADAEEFVAAIEISPTPAGTVTAPATP